MVEPRSVLAQIRVLLGNPAEWERYVSLSWLGRGKIIELHGNQYRVPNEVALLYTLLDNPSINDQDRLHQLEELVSQASSSAKTPVALLFTKVKAVIDRNSHSLPQYMAGFNSYQYKH